MRVIFIITLYAPFADSLCSFYAIIFLVLIAEGFSALKMFLFLWMSLLLDNTVAFLKLLLLFRVPHLFFFLFFSLFFFCNWLFMMSVYTTTTNKLIMCSDAVCFVLFCLFFIDLDCN